MGHRPRQFTVISGAFMQPIASVDSTFEHALFLRLFLTGGGGW